MNIRHRMAFLTRLIEKRLGGMRLVDLKDDNVMWLFNSMRNGQITKANGNNYQCVVDYVKVFKSFLALVYEDYATFRSNYRGYYS